MKCGMQKCPRNCTVNKKIFSSFKGMEHKFHEITYYEKIVLLIIFVHVSYHMISAQTSRG